MPSNGVLQKGIGNVRSAARDLQTPNQERGKAGSRRWQAGNLIKGEVRLEQRGGDWSSRTLAIGGEDGTMNRPDSEGFTRDNRKRSPWGWPYWGEKKEKKGQEALVTKQGMLGLPGGKTEFGGEGEETWTYR